MGSVACASAVTVQNFWKLQYRISESYSTEFLKVTVQNFWKLTLQYTPAVNHLLLYTETLPFCFLWYKTPKFFFFQISIHLIDIKNYFHFYLTHWSRISLVTFIFLSPSTPIIFPRRFFFFFVYRSYDLLHLLFFLPRCGKILGRLQMKHETECVRTKIIFRDKNVSFLGKQMIKKKNWIGSTMYSWHKTEVSVGGGRYWKISFLT